MLSNQITDRMEKLADEEAKLAYLQYKRDAFFRAEHILGEEIANKDELEALVKQAYEKGIPPKRLGELIAQANAQ